MSSVKEGTPLYTALLKLCSFGSHEAHEHLEVACQNTGNGIFAKQNIGAGERLFVFPFSEAIKPHGKIMEFVQKGMCSPIIGLVLTAMHELFVQKDKAPYWKYLLSLTPPNIGHCWNEEEKMFLQGTSLMVNKSTVGLLNLEYIYGNDVVKLLQELGTQLFPKDAISKDNFFTAFAWVLSRATQEISCSDTSKSNDFELENNVGAVRIDHFGNNKKTSWPSTCALIPIFDLINHTSDLQLRNAILVNKLRENNSFEVYAQSEIKKGEEVLLSYGEHSSAHLIRQYGFYEKNVYTKVVVTKMEVIESIKQSYCNAFSDSERSEMYDIIADRLQALQKLERFQNFVLGHERGIATKKYDAPLKSCTWEWLPPIDLLTFIQVIIMEDEEFSAWEDSGCIEIGLEFLDGDTANILFLALLKLFEICSERYFFEASAKESEDGTKSRKDDIASMAKSLIDEEKEFLKFAGKNVLLMLKNFKPIDSDREDGDSDQERVEQGALSNPSKRQKRE